MKNGAQRFFAGNCWKNKAVCFSGLRIATGSLALDDVIRVWDARTKDLDAQFDGIGCVLELEFSNNSNHLLALSKSSFSYTERITLSVLDLCTRSSLFKLNRHHLKFAIFSNDGLHVIALINEMIEVLSLHGDTVITHQRDKTFSLMRHPCYDFGLFATVQQQSGMLFQMNQLPSVHYPGKQPGLYRFIDCASIQIVRSWQLVEDRWCKFGTRP